MVILGTLCGSNDRFAKWFARLGLDGLTPSSTVHSSVERTKPKLGDNPHMVVLRLKRMGRRHRPFYRLNAMDKRAPRDGRVIEELGWFDPIAPEDKQISFKADRVDYWLSVGAQPSRTVVSLLKRADIDPTPGKKLS